MELKNSVMDDRQRNFRIKYREEIDGWYNGFLHIAIIYSIGFLSLYVYISHMKNIYWLEFLTIPLTFLLSNFFEWLLHKEVMHKPRNFPGAKAIYSRHVLQHHQFFTEKEVRFASSHDWRVTFFPPML